MSVEIRFVIFAALATPTQHGAIVFFIRFGSFAVATLGAGGQKNDRLVTYSDPAEAETSVSELNNSMLHERRLTVRLDRK